jgi:spermidine/putrescine transport system permease protein
MRIVHPVLERIDLSKENSSRFFQFFTYLVYFFLYAPVAVVIALSFTEQKVPQFPMSGFSLKWYGRLVPPNYNEQVVDALFQSLQIAVISAIGAGIVGTLAALAIVRGDFGNRLLSTNLLNTFFLAPIVVPWVVTGIAVLTLFSLIGIQGTFVSVVIGHMLISIPFVVLVVSSQLYGFNRKLEEAAQNLGASELRTFYEITLPLIAPGVIAGMLFAFTLSFDNFTQTFFWVGGDVQTLPIVIYSMIDTGITPTINAVGTVIVVFSVVVATAAEVLSSRAFE